MTPDNNTTDATGVVPLSVIPPDLIFKMVTKNCRNRNRFRILHRNPRFIIDLHGLVRESFGIDLNRF